jgi:hypothetical protein
MSALKTAAFFTSLVVGAIFFEALFWKYAVMSMSDFMYERYGRTGEHIYGYSLILLLIFCLFLLMAWVLDFDGGKE